MSRRMRAYYYAILGAIGGLLGWQVSNLLGLSFVKPLFLSEAVVGALIGLCVGLLIGAAEGLMTRNWARALRAGGFSGLLGLAAGAAGLPLAEFVFQAIGAGTLGRVLGWGLFGLLLGLAGGGGGGGWGGAPGVGRAAPWGARALGLSLRGVGVGPSRALFAGQAHPEA